MSRDRLPSTVKELDDRLVGAAGPSESDQSRRAHGEVLDPRETVERFLEDFERVRSDRHGQSLSWPAVLQAGGAELAPWGL